jgi:uncharacterized NAD(P)/FAD-binding protein YdhS
VDVAVIGFGFAGLSVVGHLTRVAPELRVAVIADDLSGRGLAYSTPDTGHLLNVPARRMGFWAGEPDGFTRWLALPEGAAQARSLELPDMDANAFVPRALYGRYLTATLRELLATRPVDLVEDRVRSVVRAKGVWRIEGSTVVEARCCVLATGHDPHRVFERLQHPGLHDGPWSMPAIAEDEGPVVLIGSGLTAVDAVVALRTRGYQGRVLALSRGGRLPMAHHDAVADLELSSSQASELSSIAAIVDFIRRGHPDLGWRARLDALRPHTPGIWQQLSTAQQRAAVRRWSGWWGIHRHRMAPAAARRIEAELADRSLTVQSVDGWRPEVARGELSLNVQRRGLSEKKTLRPAAVIDCTGPQLDYALSPQPLFAGLFDHARVRAHHTGVGFAADLHHRVGEQLYALGPLLVGQRWESIAAPEIRGSADAIARSITGPGRRSRHASARPRSAATEAVR